MTRLQDFLRVNAGKNGQDAIDQLFEKFAIGARRHCEYPNLVLFKYNQIDSPMDNPIVRECRGIILDESNNWAIVSRPYDKFFNIEEGHAAKIDWNTAKTYEKLDGSLMAIFNYDNRWNCQTSGMPDAAGRVGGFNFSFRNLFWDVWKSLGYRFPNSEDENLTFMFELMTPYNRVVVPHKESKIVLHGVRNRETGQEYCPEPYANKYGWQCVQSFPLTNLNEIIDAANRLNGMEHEGFVVVDAHFNRVKIKCVEYLTFAHMKDSVGARSILDIVRKNEQSEFLSYFPEYEAVFNYIKSKYDAFVAECELFYAEIKGIENQKEFALKATTKPYSGILFSLRKGIFSNVRGALVNVDLKRLEQLIGIEREDVDKNLYMNSDE